MPQSSTLLAVTWLGSADSSEQIRQEKGHATPAVILGGAAVGRVACVGGFCSSGRAIEAPRRGRLRRRSSSAFSALTFRFRGVSGDLVPQFEPRFRTCMRPTSPTEGGDIARRARRTTHSFSAFEPHRARRRRPARARLGRRIHRGSSGAVRSDVVGRDLPSSATPRSPTSSTAPKRRVVRYELSTGKVEWASREVAHYENALAGEGPASDADDP